MIGPNTEAVARFWEAFLAGNGLDQRHYEAGPFGDSPQLADELADLVRRGNKRATARLLAGTPAEGFPHVGDYGVVTDGRGDPVCVIRVTDVEVKPFRDVDAWFAYEEGEGDRTLEYWQQAHENYFRRRCDELGLEWSEDLELVLHRFEVVYPEPDQAPPVRPRLPLWRRLLQVGLTVAVVAFVFVAVIPRFADYREVVDALTDLSVGEVVILAALALLFLVAYFFVLMVVLPSLRFLEAGVAQTAGTAVTNSVPGGGALALALNYTMYMSWGFLPSAVTAALLTGGVWDNLVKMAVPVIAVTLITLSGEATAWMWIAAAAGIVALTGTLVLLALVLRWEKAAHTVGRFLNRIVNRVLGWVHRPPVDMEDITVRFRHTIVLLVGDRWLRLTVATLVNHLSMFLLLLASVRAVGISSEQLSWTWVLLSFSLGRLLSGLQITPGGLGIVEVGYLGLLSLGASEVEQGLIAAAVLLFRGLTFFPPIPVGMAGWIFWRSNTSWRRPWRRARRGELRHAESVPA